MRDRGRDECEEKEREDERKQRGNGGDYEYLLVGEEKKKTRASVVKSTNCHLASFKQLSWTT